MFCLFCFFKKASVRVAVFKSFDFRAAISIVFDMFTREQKANSNRHKNLFSLLVGANFPFIYTYIYFFLKNACVGIIRTILIINGIIKNGRDFQKTVFLSSTSELIVFFLVRFHCSRHDVLVECVSVRLRLKRFLH